MITHPKLVTALVKPGEQILKEVDAHDMVLLHMAMGIAGEGSGELLDAIKARVFYRKPLDIDNVVEELGDLEFFMEGLRQALGITREQCLEANIKKLTKRYESMSFSNDAAVERADKKEVPAPRDSDDGGGAIDGGAIGQGF